MRKQKYMQILEQEEADQKINELNEEERKTALECMLKVMNHDLNTIKESTRYIKEAQHEHAIDLQEFEKNMNKKENKLFKDYHEARVKKIKYQIEEGIYSVAQGEELLNEINIDEVTAEDLAANAELKVYADSIKIRQEKFKMTDIAEMVVDNKLLINQVDEMLK